MRFADELVDTKNFNFPPATNLRKPELDMAKALVKELKGARWTDPTTALLADVDVVGGQAGALKGETQLSSLQLTADDNSLVGSCDVGYSCAYSSTLSWLTPTLPLMSENDPRVVFERMFGTADSTDKAARTSYIRRRQSILDAVSARAAVAAPHCEAARGSPTATGTARK